MTKIIETHGLQLKVDHEVYTPREDSFLISDMLQTEEFSRELFMEIGTGSGIVSLSVGYPDSTVICTDINYAAARQTHENARYNGFDAVLVVCTDGTTPFRRGAIPSTVIFNPPYLPEDPEIDPYSPTYENQQLVGGKQGYETINTVLDGIQNEAEVVYTIISSLATNPVEYANMHEEWRTRVLKAENMGFETIWLLKMEFEH